MNSYALWYRPAIGEPQMKIATYTEPDYALRMARTYADHTPGGVYLEEFLPGGLTSRIIFCREAQ